MALPRLQVQGAPQLRAWKGRVPQSPPAPLCPHTALPVPSTTPHKHLHCPRPHSTLQTHCHTRTEMDRHTNTAICTLPHNQSSNTLTVRLIFTHSYQCKLMQMHTNVCTFSQHIKYSYPQLFKCLHRISHISTCSHTYTHSHT